MNLVMKIIMKMIVKANMILRMMLMMRIKNNATADNTNEVETTVNDDAADKNQDGH